jgi:hypothetical protein
VIYIALLDVFPMIVVLYLLKELVACREELEANEDMDSFNNFKYSKSTSITSRVG